MLSQYALRGLSSRTPRQLFSAVAGRHSNPQRAHAAAAATGSEASPPPASKAALLVIGDEILSGSIADTNTPWLAKLLYSRGVDLLRVEFIPDDIETIKAAVLALRQRVGPNGVVFTSGGIGPTHDDVTYEALAAAFNAKLELHQPTVERMKVEYAKRGVELNAARLRMATLPAPSEVLFTPGLWVPLVNLQGVYILPGIPRLFQAMVAEHQERFSGPAHITRTVYTNVGEGDVADPLARVAAAHGAVSIGSYPNTKSLSQSTDYRVKLSFSSRDAAAIEAAVAAVREVLPVFDDLPTA